MSAPAFEMMLSEGPELVVVADHDGVQEYLRQADEHLAPGEDRFEVAAEALRGQAELDGYPGR